jgi:hypothetical protein
VAMVAPLLHNGLGTEGGSGYHLAGLQIL